MVEILVVIGILGVLGAVLLPILSAARKTARKPVCISNLRQIGVAVSAYQADNDGHLPVDNPREGVIVGSGGAFRGVDPDPLEPYGTSAALYRCDAPDKPANEHGTSDYASRFVISFSEFNENASLPYRIEPNPTTVLTWDWHHIADPRLSQRHDVWIALRADGSVGQHKAGSLKKAFLRNGKWILDDQGRDYYQYVFPGEDWPPEFTRLPQR